MKKLLSMIIMLVLVISMFVGCNRDGSISNEKTFPSKTIELVVPFSAGGATDALARVLAKEASAFLPNRQNIVIINKPGASGTLGVMDVLKADSDGYTIGIGYTSLFTQIPYIVANVKYDRTKFDYLMTATSTVTVLQTPKNSPIKTFEDFVDATKNGSESLTIGVMGIGGPGHLAMEQLAYDYGMNKYIPVPFKSSTEAWNGMAQGSIDVNFVSADTENTEINLLVTNFPERSSLFPNVPTLKELGYDSNDTNTKTILFCKEDVPEDIKNIIYEAFSKAAQTEQFKKTAEQFSTEYAYENRESTKKLVEDEYVWVFELLNKIGLVVNDPTK